MVGATGFEPATFCCAEAPKAADVYQADRDSAVGWHGDEDAGQAVTRSLDTLAVMNHHTGEMSFFGPESKQRVAFGTAAPATTAL